MRVIKYIKCPKPETQELHHDPMIVFLTKTTELRIERGDKLQAVARVVHSALGLERIQCRQLVALWFALGERRAAGNPPKFWTDRELRINGGRRYLFNRRPARGAASR